MANTSIQVSGVFTPAEERTGTVSPLDDALIRLTHTIDSLALSYDRLETKLRPVRNDNPLPVGDDDGLEKPALNNSTVTSAILDTEERVSRLNNAMNVLIYQLDV